MLRIAREKGLVQYHSSTYGTMPITGGALMTDLMAAGPVWQ